MSLKKLKGLSFLGAFFALHVLKKIFRINQRGKKEFEKNYAQDRIFSISEQQRFKMVDYSQCTSCRICDTVCPLVNAKPNKPAPSYLVGTFARSLTDYDLFDDDFICGDCCECEKVCPQNVPIRGVIEFIKNGKKQIESVLHHMINQATFIINPHAGHTRSNEDWQKFHLPTLKFFFPPGEYRFTDHPGHATFLTRQALKSGVHTIIAIGGDGTINEVVNGFFENNQPINPQATLGIIPFGSGGDFARTLGLKRNLADAAKDLLTAQPKAIDIGLITFSISSDPCPLTPEPCSRFFINIAEAGLGGLVMQKVNAKNKKIPALLRYLSGTIQGLRTYRDIVVKMTVDDQKPHFIKLTNLVVANGRFFGHGMCPAPFAELDDGFFDVLVLENHSGLKFGRLLPSLYSTKRNPNYVNSFRCQQITLEVADPTKTLITEVDGEVCGTGDVTFQLKEKAMSILCPQNQTA